MYINEIMTVSVKTCTTDSTLQDTAELMRDFDCGAIPIVNEQNQPIGIVTDRDIVMTALANHKPLWEIGVTAVTQGQRLCCCHQEDPVEFSLVKMEQNGIRRLPVVGEDGRLVGIVSMGDAVAFASARKADKESDKGVPIDNLLAMLQHVSAHHEVKENALTVM